MNLTTVKSKTQSPQDAKKSPAAKGSAAQPSEKPFNLLEYLKGVKQEWHKISWPTRPQIIAETGVVLVVVTIFSLFVYLVDKTFQFIIQIIT